MNETQKQTDYEQYFGEMSEKYPNPCCRCGFCCLSGTCPVAMRSFNINKDDPCPALRFKNHIAYCDLIGYFVEKVGMDRKAVNIIMGIGQGCCIKSTAIKNEVEYDFASLPKEIKIKVAQSIRRKKQWNQK